MKRWQKIVLATVLGLVVFLVVLYVVVTRPAFLKTVVIPRIEKTAGQDIEITAITWRPFSYLGLEGVRVGSVASPLLEAEKLTCAYSLTAFARNRVEIDRLHLVNATVRIDAAHQTEAGPEEESPSRQRGGAKPPPTLDIRRVDLENVRFLYRRPGGGEAPPLNLELKNAEVHLRNLEPGKKASLEIESDLTVARGEQFALPRAHLTGNASAALDSAGMPTSINFGLVLQTPEGHAGRVGLAGHTLSAEGDLRREDATYHIDTLRLEETVEDTQNALVRIQGSVTPEPLEAELDIQADPVGPSLLNTIAAAASDFDLGETSAGFSSHVVLKPGPSIEAKGHLTVDDLTVSSERLELRPLPPAQLEFGFETRMQVPDKQGVIESFNLDVTQNATQILNGTLAGPVHLSWAEADRSKETDPVALKFTVTDFDLAMLRPVLGPEKFPLHTGRLNGALSVTVENQGEIIRSQSDLALTDLELDRPGVDTAGLRFSQSADITLTDFTELVVQSGQTRLTRGDKLALDLRESGSFNLEQKSGSLNLEVASMSEALVAIVQPAQNARMQLASLDLSGTLSARIAEGLKRTDYKADLNARNLRLRPEGGETTPALESMLRASGHVSPGTNAKVNELLLTVRAPEQRLLHLRADATLPLPVFSDTVRVSLQSEELQAERLKSMLKSEKPGEEDKTGEDESEEKPETDGPPLPPELSLVADFEFQKIEYRKSRITGLRGTARIDDGRLDIDPLNLRLNGAPATWRSSVDFSKKPVRYRVRASLQNLETAPLIASFSDASSDMVTGKLDRAEFNFDGAGFEKRQLLQALTGKLDIDIGSLQVPTDPARAAQLPGLNLLVLPVTLLARIGNFVPSNMMTDKLKSLQNEASGYLKTASKLDFKSGKVTVEMRDRVLTIPEFSLDGSFISPLTLKGNIDWRPGTSSSAGDAELIPKLNLTLGMSVQGLQLHVPVSGTLDAPSAAPQALVRGLITGLGATFFNAAGETVRQGKKLNPENLIDALFREREDSETPASGRQDEQQARPDAKKSAKEAPDSEGRAEERDQKEGKKALEELGDSLLREFLRPPDSSTGERQ